VVKLLPETAKWPPDPFVTIKLQGIIVPFASVTVSTPTTVPGGALSTTLELLIVIVINISGRTFASAEITISVVVTP
jgi:hypothetical protein